MPRQARLDAPGTLHHVIVRGTERRKIVDDGYDAQAFVERIGAVAVESGTEVYAWSLMTNHLHMLLRSGSQGLSKYMRRVLTGYAMAYNRRHGRHGHLFQNRYKSIVCDEDMYFKELVRYIHLNPIRAKLVKRMSDLDRYAWCGHSAIMGLKNNTWQNRDYVLSWFGVREKEAKKAYREFVAEGIQDGKRPELVGGGLIRSLGGWSAVKSMRRKGERAVTDERILGSGGFVERLLHEAEEKTRRQIGRNASDKAIAGRIAERCREGNVSIKELQMGSRRGRISEVRGRLIKELVAGYGLPLAEVARHLGVTTGAVSNCLERAKKK